MKRSGEQTGFGRRVLLTGSAGLVGQRLRDKLVAAAYEVVVFDLALDRSQDIRDAEAVTIAMQGCAGVVHLAAMSRVAWGESAPALCRSINTAGTDIVIAAAKSLPVPPWLVFASSREVYGNPTTFPVREDAPLAPVNAYGRSKVDGERAVGASGLRNVIVRLSNVYGTEHDHPDRAVPSLLWRAMQGRDLQITGAESFFDFVHVDDCALGLMLAVDRLAGGAPSLPPLHLATGVATSLADLAQMAIDVASSTSAIDSRPARSFDVAGFVGDPARAREVLGFRAEVSLLAGLRRLQKILAARGRAPDPVALPRAAAPTSTIVV